MTARQDSDNLAWDRSDELWEEKKGHIRLRSTTRKVMMLVERILGEPVVFVPPLLVGGFNVLYPIRLGSSSGPAQWLVRLPCRTEELFHAEKVRIEAATIEYLRQHPQLPIPQILSHGNDLDLGPYMIIQEFHTRRDISDCLQKPGQDPEDSPILDPDISDARIKSIYSQMAGCLLQFAQLTFPRIGSLSKSSMGFDVTGRPVTLNMSNMVQLSNIPKSIFPSEQTTFGTADEWYTALAEMQMATLLFQHNDIITSENDCRTKYMARKLFYKLAKQGRLSSFGFAGCELTPSATLPVPDNSNSFRFWPDDLRPANFLVDDNEQITGIIDWEFAYAAPAQFILDPPWWLLIEVPEMWETGIDDWVSTYSIRLETWLLELEKAEKEMLPDSLRLSAYMREGWETGRFWVNYAARKSWAFDVVYWRFLDGKFFGKRGGGPTEMLWNERVHLLSEREQKEMEVLVQMKMEESKERILVDWDAEEANKRLEALLLE